MPKGNFTQYFYFFFPLSCYVTPWWLWIPSPLASVSGCMMPSWVWKAKFFYKFKTVTENKIYLQKSLKSMYKVSQSNHIPIFILNNAELQKNDCSWKEQGLERTEQPRFLLVSILSIQTLAGGSLRKVMCLCDMHHLNSFKSLQEFKNSTYVNNKRKSLLSKLNFVLGI